MSVNKPIIGSPPSSYDSFSSWSSSSDENSDDELSNVEPIMLNNAPKGKEPVGSDSDSETEFFSFSESEDDAETINLQATRRPMPPVVMYNDLGGGFRKDALVSDARLKQSVEDTFCHLKALIVGDLSDKKVQIDIDNRIVWTYEADGTGATTKNLDELTAANPEMKDCAQALIKLARQVWPDISSTPPTINPGSKAPDTAQSVGPSFVTQQIANDYSTCAKLALKLYATKESDPAKQDAALKRITAIESIICEMQKTIDRQKGVEEQRLLAALDPDKPAIQAEIAKLQARSDANKQLNRLGLYVAAAFASSAADPKTALAAADKAAQDIQEVLQARLDKVHTKKIVNRGVKTWLPKIVPEAIRGTPTTLIPKDEAYAKWAAPLAYSVLPEELARKGAAGYWVREKSSSYKDGVEDELIRFVVRRELNPASADPISTPQLDVIMGGVPGFVDTFKNLAAPIFTNAVPAGATMGAKVDAMKTQHNLA